MNVDISVFSSPVASFATVWGEVELPDIPSAGDDLSFYFLNDESLSPAAQETQGWWRVDKCRFDAGRVPPCTLELSDIVVDGDQAARNICGYLERVFRLYVEYY